MGIAAIGSVKRWAADPQHALWVVLQMFLVRGVVALKLLLAARLLGPEQVGLVGIALLTLAIVESISDTGLSQAVIQHRERIGSWQGGSIWSLQVTRGFVLALGLIGLAIPIGMFFKEERASTLIALAALLPIVRNAFNPGLVLAQRDRNFRGIAGLEGASALADLAVTLIAIRLGVGAASMLLGVLAADVLKCASTWTLFRYRIRPNFHWGGLRELTSFGKWVWGSSVVTLLLNQLDKVLVARFLGTAEFGLYQVASRIAQLVIADSATAIGQYLYPTFAHRFRVSEEYSRGLFRYVFVRVFGAALTIALLLSTFSNDVVSIALGEAWMPASRVLKVLAFSMCVGAVIAVLVPYCRAIGRPKIVTAATLLQLLVLAPLSVAMIWAYGAMGMAFATLIAGVGAALVMWRASGMRHG